MKLRTITLLAYVVAGSAAFASHSASDHDLLSANVQRIQACLDENKGADSDYCIGATKGNCKLDVPTCNRQEAAAWDEIAFQKKPSLKKSQKAWQKRVNAACAYKSKAAGYKDVFAPEHWEQGIAPTGCMLQSSARRAVKLHKHSK